LSEFTGASKSLGAGSIKINPWNISEISEAINFSLNMGEEEKEAKHS
jgi:trehalose 6-phosphate synthase/phosphatase